jgi:hypothetical protein
MGIATELVEIDTLDFFGPPCCTRLDPRLRPPSTLGEIFMRKCPINFLALLIFPKKPKKLNPLGQGGPPNFVLPHFFLWLKAPYNNSFWEKSNPAEERKKRNNAVNSGHLVLWQRTQAARAKIKAVFKAIYMGGTMCTPLPPPLFVVLTTNPFQG